MKKSIFLTLSLSIAITSSLASELHYFSGQKEYLDNCRICHQGSSIFVNQYTMKEWRELLDNDGKKLTNIHADLKNADFVKHKREVDVQDIKDYLNSETYVKRLKHLKAFTDHFAKDGSASN